MNHAIIGANVMDRLVKCPGSLKCGSGTLKQKDEQRKKNLKNYYTKNRIECNRPTELGMKIDEMSKNLVRTHFGAKEKIVYTSDLDYADLEIYTQAKEYAEHMINVRKKMSKCFLDPGYDVSKYIQNLDDVEFRVSFNPDYIAVSESGKIVYISDLTTGVSYSRNKMFQVICCAVGYMEYHSECERFICEVFNSNTKEVNICKFDKEEIEAYRDDIIIPTLEKVREALSSPKQEIENFRNRNSWCRGFCIFKDDGCCSCKSADIVENDIQIQLSFDYKHMSQKDLDNYLDLWW